MRRFESLKRVIVLWLSFVGLLFHTAIYAYIWVEYYYPTISRFTARLKFNRNGHLGMFAIYLVLLYFFVSTYGGLKIGYLKPMDVFFSQVFSLLFVQWFWHTLEEACFLWRYQRVRLHLSQI